MNDYGFDYMNYITNVPNSMNFASQNYVGQNNYDMNYTKEKTIIPKMMKETTIEPYQGLIRGNLFSNLYDPYKNYKPSKLDPKNEREALLYQLLQYKFALTDLDLYLDTHPNDTEKIALYNQYSKIEKQICDKYESMYGPLTLDSNYLNQNNWVWKNSPWPWEVM